MAYITIRRPVAAVAGMFCVAAVLVWASTGRVGRALPGGRVPGLDGGVSAPAVHAVVVAELFTSEGCSTCPPADEVLGRLVHEPAIAARFLQEHRVYHVDVTRQPLVVVTTATGANRVYESNAHRFVGGADDDHLLDAEGETWVVEENQLRPARDPKLVLRRVPAHRAFWFGWFAQHPDTVLIK